MADVPLPGAVRDNLKSRAKALAWRIAPGLMSDRGRRYSERVRASHGITDLAHRFIDRHGADVLGGPFAGMHYPLPAAEGPIQRLLGCYEAEIHEAIRMGIQSAPRAFIDLGCADGYYAVGFARASPATVVHAFDVSRSARRACRALAEANAVAGRLSLHGKATIRALQRLPLGGSVVLCDVDGAELDIFTDAAVAALSSATVIIELHSLIRPGTEAALLSRFGRSHACEVVTAKPRDPLEFPQLEGFSEAERDLAVDELRWRTDGFRWGVFSPRSM